MKPSLFPKYPSPSRGLIPVLALLLGVFAPARAATFYYDGSGPANTLENWWINPDGTGSNPVAFTTADQEFVVQDGQTLTTNDGWSISASNQLTIQGGGTFSSGSAIIATLNLEAGATYRSQTNSQGLTSGVISLASDFVYDGVANTANPLLAYGNLSIFNPASHFFVGSVTTTGNFSLSAVGNNRMNLANNADATINVGKDVLIASSVKLFRLTNSADPAFGLTLNIDGGLINDGIITNGSATTSINFNGTGESDVKWGTLTSTYHAKVTIGAAKTIAFLDSYDSHNSDLEVSGELLLSSASTVNTGTGAFVVKNGGRLVGSGTSGSLVVFEEGSTHAPGNSPGQQVLAGGVSYTGAAVEWELIENTAEVLDAGVLYDSILVTGGNFLTSDSVINLFYNGAESQVDFASGFWESDHAWTIIDSSVNRSGDFLLGSISLDSLGQSHLAYGNFSLDSSDLQDVVLTWTASPIPEPSTAALSLLALGGMAALRRGRTRKGRTAGRWGVSPI